MTRLTHYATFSQRSRALFLDSIWWTVIALFIPLGSSIEDIPLSTDGIATFLLLSAFEAQLVPILITGVLWAMWGTSPGKRVVRIRIVDADSELPMSKKQALLRTIGYLLTFATCGAGFAWVFFNPRKQALHDRIANTVVIAEAPRSD